ncbi:transglycosylase SLT domain-containing protein [Arenimonas alkanexedens]
MTPTRFALLAGLVLLAACQPAVRPDPLEPDEPATPILVTPRVVAAPPAKPEPAPVAAPDPMDTGAEVIDRMRARFSSPVCVKGQYNHLWRKRYAGYPDNFARHVEQILPLMGYVVEEVERRNLPGEFALLPIVESWYRPDAIGPGGPAGMWQMIATTARNHGIRIRPGYDGRLSPVASTDAALDYLEALDEKFGGEWRAMAMGYNAGEYRILRAFKANNDDRVSGERRLPRGLSNTTYDYVAKLHALACLFEKPERHNLVLPREARFTPLVRVEIPAGVGSLDQAAIRLGVDAAALRALNPAYRQGRVLSGVPREVLAPATALAQLAQAQHDDSAPAIVQPVDSDARVHEVNRGDSLSRIAQRYGVPLRELFDLNGLNARSILRPGQRIRIDP